MKGANMEESFIIINLEMSSAGLNLNTPWQI